MNLGEFIRTREEKKRKKRSKAEDDEKGSSSSSPRRKRSHSGSGFSSGSSDSEASVIQRRNAAEKAEQQPAQTSTGGPQTIGEPSKGPEPPENSQVSVSDPGKEKDPPPASEEKGEDCEIDIDINEEDAEGGSGGFKMPHPVVPTTRRPIPNEASSEHRPATLAEIRNRAREQAEAERDTEFKRYKMLSYSSEDSQRRADAEDGRKLRTYYCSVCGSHSLVTDVDVFAARQRKFDGAFPLNQMGDHFAKTYLKAAKNRVLLRRSKGIEQQYRQLCQDCQLPLAYRFTPPDEPAKHIYFFKDSLVDEQSKAEALQLSARAVEASKTEDWRPPRYF